MGDKQKKLKPKRDGFELQGNLVLGDWRLKSGIGKGGQGEVWSLEYLPENHVQPSAAKVNFASSQKGRERFHREVKILESLQHENLITIRESDLDWRQRHEDLPDIKAAYYVMPRAEFTLEDFPEAKLNLCIAIELFVQACAAAHYLHSQSTPIIHRDLKPSNLLIFSRERRRLAVSDLGCAVEIDDQGLLTARHESIGTPNYRAPEAANSGGHTAQCDVYSLGRILLYLLNGIHPERYTESVDTKLHNLSPSLAAAFEDIVSRATALDPVNRFRSVQELADSLPSFWTDCQISENLSGIIENGDECGANAVIEALENEKRNSGAKIRRFMRRTVARLDDLEPVFRESNKPDDEILMDALAKTIPVVGDSLSVFRAIAEHGEVEFAAEAYREMGQFFERYQLNPHSGPSSRYVFEFDYFKFLGHEIFVGFVATLIESRRWEILGKLLAEELYVQSGTSALPTVPFAELSRHIDLADRRKTRLASNLISMRGDWLNARYTGILQDVLSMVQFVEADFFLFLRKMPSPGQIGWIPWSVIYERSRVPRFLVEAQDKGRAQEIAGALGLSSIGEFRDVLERGARTLPRIWSSPFVEWPGIWKFDSAKIGGG